MAPKANPLVAMREAAVVPVGGNHEVSVRKIHNGYIARHSMSDGKGKYTSREVYHPTAPSIGIAQGPIPKLDTAPSAKGRPNGKVTP